MSMKNSLLQQTMTEMSMEQVKKGAEKREKQVMLMVSLLIMILYVCSNHNQVFQVVTMVGVFLFCWGPYALLSIMGILGLEQVSKINLLQSQEKAYFVCIQYLNWLRYQKDEKHIDLKQILISHTELISKFSCQNLC